MRKGILLAGLVVVTALAVAAAIWSQRQTPAIARSGELLFPGLLERLNGVSEIAVVAGGDTTTLRAGDGGWVVTERWSYPADREEIRKLLIGAAELRRVEPKTSKPELYGELELADPAKEGAQSIGYVFKTADGAPLADFVVGKRRLLTGSADVDQYFVRVAADPQVWLVEGQIPKNRALTDWLRREVVRIDRARVHRVTVRHPDGESIRVVKSKPGDDDYQLLGIPEGHEVDVEYAVQSIATTPADLTLNDVVPLEEADFSGEDRLQIVLETFDGLTVTMESGEKGESTYLRLRAESDPALRALVAAPAAEGEPAPAAGKTAEEVAAEAAALNERWSRWAYAVPDYVLDTLRKRMDQLVKAPEPPQSDPESAPASSPESAAGSG